MNPPSAHGRLKVAQGKEDAYRILVPQDDEVELATFFAWSLAAHDTEGYGMSRARDRIVARMALCAVEMRHELRIELAAHRKPRGGPVLGRGMQSTPHCGVFRSLPMLRDTSNRMAK